jgi:hypothetical protein
MFCFVFFWGVCVKLSGRIRAILFVLVLLDQSAQIRYYVLSNTK